MTSKSSLRMCGTIFDLFNWPKHWAGNIKDSYVEWNKPLIWIKDIKDFEKKQIKRK